jgi:hypothetical protein
MNPKDMEEQIIQNYQRDEKMMILVFAQWCINHNLDPTKLYIQAYPNQTQNDALKEAIELTVPKHESEEIPTETLLGALSLFGNEDLAFIVTELMNKRES